MKAFCTTLLTCAGLMLSVSPLRADFIATATLTPGADGATNSNGNGTATVAYTAANNDFTYNLSWANLTGSATMAHIHLGAPGVDGPILIPFFMSTMPGTDTLTGTLTQADVTPANGISTIAQVAQAIEAGNAYVNIHTVLYPAGELRGQLATSSSATPEPATTGLMLLAGTAGFVTFLRKRRIAQS